MAKTNKHADPTCYAVIKKADIEEREKFYSLLNTLFYICDLAGFKVVGHITLKDKKTGRIWN